MTTDMISIPKEEYIQMRSELETLRHTKLYERLLQFIQNISTGKKYTREDIGF